MHLAKDVLDAVEVEEWQLGYKSTIVNGIPLQPKVSDTQPEPCHFRGINLLGMDYLKNAYGDFRIDMLKREVVLDTQIMYKDE